MKSFKQTKPPLYHPQNTQGIQSFGDENHFQFVKNNNGNVRDHEPLQDISNIYSNNENIYQNYKELQSQKREQLQPYLDNDQSELLTFDHLDLSNQQEYNTENYENIENVLDVKIKQYNTNLNENTKIVNNKKNCSSSNRYENQEDFSCSTISLDSEVRLQEHQEESDIKHLNEMDSDDQKQLIEIQKQYEKTCQDLFQRYDIKKSFVTGRKSEFGENSYFNANNAMDQVILRHHRAAQKQYLKMKNNRGGDQSKLSCQANRNTLQSTSKICISNQSNMKQEGQQNYQDIYTQRKKSIQSNIPQQLLFNRNNSSSSHRQQDGKKSQGVTPTNNGLSCQENNNNSHNGQIFVFPQESSSIKDSQFQSINCIQGLTNRKQSAASNYSTISLVSRRTTDQQPFNLSRSNSRRTRDIVKIQVDHSAKAAQEFKAREAPKATPKFFALKSTKQLTVPHEVKLITDEREKSKQRQDPQTTRNTISQRVSSLNNFKAQQRENSSNSKPVFNLASKHEMQMNNSVEKMPPHQDNYIVSNNENENCINIQSIYHSRKNSQVTVISNNQNCSQKLQKSNSNFAGTDIQGTRIIKNNNVKKMKINHNYGQMVNYAKSKFVSQ